MNFVCLVFELGDKTLTLSPIVAQLKLNLENKITSSFGRMNLVSN